MKCLVNVDGDFNGHIFRLPHGSPNGEKLGGWISVEQREKAVLELFSIFDEAGLKGRVTWFINENHFRWTENHPNLLREIDARGDSIGVHDHFHNCWLMGLESIPDIHKDNYAYCLCSKEKLETFFGRKFYLHTNGCLCQSVNTYRALRMLGYRILRDVYPGRVVSDFDGSRVADNTRIPLDASPWRHDENNWLDYTSTEGWFLHVPLTYEEAFTAQFLQKAKKVPYFVWIAAHPCTILINKGQKVGDIDPNKTNAVLERIQMIKEILKPEFMNFDELASLYFPNGLKIENEDPI